MNRLRQFFALIQTSTFPIAILLSFFLVGGLYCRLLDWESWLKVLERLAYSLCGRSLSIVLCKWLGLNFFGGWLACFLTLVKMDSLDLITFMDAPAPQPPAENVPQQAQDPALTPE